jgi:hypothetical protein
MVCLEHLAKMTNSSGTYRRYQHGILGYPDAVHAVTRAVMHASGLHASAATGTTRLAVNRPLMRLACGCHLAGCPVFPKRTTNEEDLPLRWCADQEAQTERDRQRRNIWDDQRIWICIQMHRNRTFAWVAGVMHYVDIHVHGNQDDYTSSFHYKRDFKLVVAPDLAYPCPILIDCDETEQSRACSMCGS